MKSIPLNSNPIVSEQVFEYVSSKLSFPLTFEQWRIIDVAMAEYWNNRVIGAIICNDDNAAFIHKHCRKNTLLIPYDHVLEITTLIWEYLESKRRLEDF